MCFLDVSLFDITEVKGADVLRGSEGIIKESQKNAAALLEAGRPFIPQKAQHYASKQCLLSLK